MGNSCCKKVKTVDEKEVLKQIKESNTIETTKIFDHPSKQNSLKQINVNIALEHQNSFNDSFFNKSDEGTPRFSKKQQQTSKSINSEKITPHFYSPSEQKKFVQFKRRELFLMYSSSHYRSSNYQKEEDKHLGNSPHPKIEDKIKKKEQDGKKNYQQTSNKSISSRSFSQECKVIFNSRSLKSQPIRSILKKSCRTNSDYKNSDRDSFNSQSSLSKQVHFNFATCEKKKQSYLQSV